MFLKKKKNRTKLKRSKSSTNLQSRLSHLSEISMATDIFPLATYGVQGNLQLRDETRARAIPLFFAFSLLVPSVLLPTRYPSLVLVFFFFFFGFPSCARLDSRQLGARQAVLYVLEKLEDFRNSWTFRSFHLSLWSARKKKMDERSFA